MCLDLDISRDHPLELPVDFDPLFLVYNSVVEDARDLGDKPPCELCRALMLGALMR